MPNMKTDTYDITMFPETHMDMEVPAGARILGITHDRPYPHLRLEYDINLHLVDEAPMERRIFRATTFEDVNDFDPTGWEHRATTLIGGEEPGDVWITIHVWEKVA